MDPAPKKNLNPKMDSLLKNKTNEIRQKNPTKTGRQKQLEKFQKSQNGQKNVTAILKTPKCNPSPAKKLIKKYCIFWCKNVHQCKNLNWEWDCFGAHFFGAKVAPVQKFTLGGFVWAQRAPGCASPLQGLQQGAHRAPQLLFMNI